MKKKAIQSGLLFFLLLICTLISCDQDSIFADIAVEPEYKDPKINGSSTNLVVYDDGDGDTMYVATIGSGTIHTYKAGNWGSLSSPAGAVIGLAATSGYLYALVGDINRVDNSLHRYNGPDSDPKWTQIKGSTGSLQSIWGANDTLFAGAMDGTAWKVYSVTDTGAALSEAISDSGMLNGAAHDGTDYYIATSNGIYKGASIVTGSEGIVTGILNVNDVITAVVRYTNPSDKKVQGKILTYNGSRFNTISNGGPAYTGAMCVWKKYDESGNATDKLLLLGIESSENYDSGYRELTLGNDGKPKTSNQEAVPPGGESSSIKPDDKSRYDASLARYNVYHILQVPEDVDPVPTGSQPLVFASTTKNGVWVLNRAGEWNAQD
jgi:hypothetical protein